MTAVENRYNFGTSKTRPIKSKIEYFSILNPNKIIRAWNKHKAAKKLKTEISKIREKKNCRNTN